jgi:hypothetical protein
MTNPETQPGSLLNALSEITKKREDKARIQGILESGEITSPAIVQAYEIAIRQLAFDEASLASSSDVQGYYATVLQTAQKEIVQLEPLVGILSETDINTLRSSAEERALTAQEFFSAYGSLTPEETEFVVQTGAELAVTQTVEVSPVPESDDEPEASIASDDAALEASGAQETEQGTPTSVEMGEALKTTVRLRVKGSVLQIGKQGKIIPLAAKTIGNRRDYSDMRVRALKALADPEHEDRMFNPHELWANMYDDGRPYDSDAMISVRKWLEKLTFRKEAIVITNKKRAMGSRYWVSPSFQLEFVDDTVVDWSNEAQPTELKIDLGDLYLAARHLEQFDFVFRQLGYPEMERGMSEALKPHIPDYSHLKGDERAIRAQRLEAVERIEAMVNDESRFLAFLDSIEKDSAESKMATFLSDIDGVEQWTLVKRLFTSRIIPLKTNGKTMLEVVDGADASVGFFEVSERKTKSEVESIPKESPTVPENTKDDEAIESSAQPKELAHDTEVELRVAEQPTTPPTETQRRGRSAESENLEKQQLQTLREAMESVANRYFESGLSADLEKRYKRMEVQGRAFPAFTTRAVRDALSNRIVGGEANSKHPTFNVQDIVDILVYIGPVQNIYRLKKFDKIKDKIRDQVIAKAIADKEAEPTGDDY